MPWGDKAVSPVVYTPAVADASGWALDAGIDLENGRLGRPRKFLAFKLAVSDVVSTEKYCIIAEIETWLGGSKYGAPASVSASSSYEASDFGKLKAFDGTAGAGGWNTVPSFVPSWISWVFSESKEVDKIRIYRSSDVSRQPYAPKNFVIYGSSTGAFAGEEIALATVSGASYTSNYVDVTV